MALLACLLVSCCEDDIEPMPTPPVEPEQPEQPIAPPTTDDLIKIKINDEIMAIIGSNTWNAIAYGNGKYVAVGTDGYITMSTDGANWTTPKQVIIPRGNYWNAITYGNGKFVTCGYSTYMGNGYISTSINGITWTEPQQLARQIWNGITYSNGKFVVVGSGGRISTSVNGTSWTTPNWFDSGHNMIAVTYGNGKFVVVGNSGVIGTSVDGISWTKSDSVSGIDVTYDIAYGNGKFVAVGYTGSYGYITTSNDGKTWTTPIKYPNNPLSSWPIKWTSVIYSNNIFAAIGYAAYNTGSFIMTSYDGITWTDPVQIKDELGNGITANVLSIVPIL